MISPTRRDRRARWMEALEALHRVTSLIVRDLERSIAALSAVGANALRSVDDRDVRRDALHTVARTVIRMQSMLGRLRDGAGATLPPRAPLGRT